MLLLLDRLALWLSLALSQLMQCIKWVIYRRSAINLSMGQDWSTCVNSSTRSVSRCEITDAQSTDLEMRVCVVVGCPRKWRDRLKSSDSNALSDRQCYSQPSKQVELLLGSYPGLSITQSVHRRHASRGILLRMVRGQLLLL